jgi:lipid II:glycine glycyltransferase (peptidoglycan interpeptide bridge formation enzyme)
MNLTLEPEEILMAMKTTTRNEVRQAIKNGINVVFKDKPTSKDIKIFYEIYLETMNRLESSNYYKFSFDFFLNTFNLLEEKAELVFVYKNDNLLSSAIFLLSDNISHYHLSGSLHQYLPLRPNNIMLYQAALRYKLMEKKYLHLGGGYKGNDSLFSFKEGFNKNSLLDFYIGSKVFDEKAYNAIVRKWKEKNHLGKDFQSDFFPLYRLNIEGDE